MTLLEAAAVLLAGVAAGTINTMVGAGSLVSFPTLLALGLPPLVANASNTVGLVPGGVSGTLGYRRELAGQRTRLVWILGASLIGGTIGAVLLLVLPETVFESVVPVLLVIGSVLVGVQPALSRKLKERSSTRVANGPQRAVPLSVLALVVLCSVYGGYFGAGQGVIMIAVLSIGLESNLQVVNALKNAQSTVTNFVAAVVFVAVAPLNWLAILLIAVGSIVGGQLGSSVGRKLPAPVLRTLIVVLGLVVAAKLALT